jgi:predicted neuraminidase
MIRRLIFFLLLFGASAASVFGAAPQAPPADSAIEKKASVWVASLQLNSPEKEARVTALIATHLTEVRDWNNEHPYTTVPAGIDPATGKPLSTMDRQIIAVSSMPRSVHDSLMNGLRRELTPDQVGSILDKYTIGKVAFTLNGYKAIVPDLSPQEEATILANLQQAREQAIDYKNAKQISAIFEIYKTKCEQFLNANGRNWHMLFKTYVNTQKEKKAILASGFIYDTAPFPECHAATIAETTTGLVTAFFGGTEERNPDVCIYVSRKDQGSGKWTAPVNVANGIQNSTLRYACWNPVLYQVPGGDLLLFYKVGPSPAKWKGWLIRSKDGGITWSKPWALPEGFLGPIKDQPVALPDGTLLCPTSVEGNGWKVHFELAHHDARKWEMAGPVPAADSLRAIQPTILFLKDGTLEALCRSDNRAILSTTSKDNGKTWSPLAPTTLPNNNSGIDGTTLADGRQLLVYNHVLPPAGETKGERSPLNVSVSPDGQTWYASLVLEDDHTGQYSYPSVIQSKDGKVHIVYTWHRKKIKYVELDPSKLPTEKIENGSWPDAIKK